MFPEVFPVLIAIFSAYMLGNLNGSVCISTLFAKDDVRNHGSGNAGLTNFFRSYGGWSTLLVILVDVLKTVLACYGAGLMLLPYGKYQEGLMLGALAVTLGHDFPALLGWRGGKGILSGLTIALVIDWRIGLIIFGVFVIAFAISRFVSLGSVLGALSMAVCFVIFHHDHIFIMVGGILLGVLAIFMHRTNIKRFFQGKEAKTHLINKDK